MKRIGLLAGATALMSAGAIADFTDNFETDTSANYRSYIVSVPATAPIDGKTVFSFDHGGAWPWDDFTPYSGSAALNSHSGSAIPPSPGSSTTKALYTRVNEKVGETTSVDATSIIPNTRFLGDYTVEVDMWVEVTSSGTSTHLTTFGLEMGNDVGFSQGISGKGYVFGLVADGSASRDYRIYKKSLENTALAGWGPSAAPFQNNSNAYYAAAFPNPNPASFGNLGGILAIDWYSVRLKRAGTQISWEIRNNNVTENPTLAYTKMLEFSDTDYTNGYVMLGMFDPAASPRPTDQPLFSMFDNLKITGTNAPKITGKVNPLGWLGTPPTAVSIQCYDDAVAGNLIETLTSPLDAGGNYLINVLPSTRSIRVDYSHWLPKRIAVDASLGNASGKDFNLTNGDANKDNIVDFFDYLLVSDAYESEKGQPLYDANPDADLNGDTVIDFFDYLILSDSYEVEGDN